MNLVLQICESLLAICATNFRLKLQQLQAHTHRQKALRRDKTFDCVYLLQQTDYLEN